MAEGRQRDEWDRVSALMAHVANCNPYRKGNAFHPRDFNPYEVQKQDDTLKVETSVVRAMFSGLCKPKKPKKQPK